MSRLLVLIAAMLVVVLSALFAGPHLVNWNDYRGAFEREASRVLGAQVRVGGNVNVRLLPIPFVRFERVRVASPAAEDAEPIFRAENLTLWLAPGPLLRGAVEARSVELVRPRLRLAVQADGGGSWRGFSLATARLPLAPAEVTLDSLTITDGSLSLEGPGGRALAEIGRIDSTLVADAASGPFKVNGTLEWQGARREVRISTTAMGEDGSMRLKLSVAVPDTTNTYTFDGDLSDLFGKPRLTGQAGMRIDRRAKAGAEQAAPSIEVRSRIDADVFGALADQLTISFDIDGQPQLLEGRARAAWRDAPEISMEVASQWLNVDAITGTSGNPSALAAIGRLSSALGAAMPEAARVQVQISVDQSTLGGDVASGLRLALVSEKGVTGLERLTVALPGGARLAVSGRLIEETGRQTFDGDAILNGSSLARFMAWAGRGLGRPATQGDGAFAIGGAFKLSRDRVELRSGHAALGGAEFDLAGDYGWADRRSLRLSLDGERVDISALAGGLLGDGGVLGLIADRIRGRNGTGFAAGMDVALNVRAKRLDDGVRALDNVALDAEFNGDVATIKALKLATGEGLLIDAEGTIAHGAGAARGQISGHVTLASPEAVRSLRQLAAPELPELEMLSALLPARLGFVAAPGSGPGGGLDLRLNGSASGDVTLAATMRTGGRLADWRTTPMEASFALSGRDMASILRISGQPSPQQAATTDEQPGAAVVRAELAGVPAAGMVAHGSLEAQGATAIYDGRVAFGTSNEVAIDGAVGFETANAALLAAALGVEGLLPADLPASGSLKIDRKDGRLAAVLERVRIGPSTLRGRLSVVAGGAAAGQPAAGLEADLEVDRVRLDDLLASLLDPSAADRDPEAKASPFASERAFQLARIKAPAGSLRLSFERMDVADGLAITAGRLEAELANGSIRVSSLTGRAADGRVQAELSLAQTTAGAQFQGRLAVTGLDIRTLAGGDALAEGRADLTVEAGGRALSPRALAHVLKGTGELALRRASLPGLTAKAVTAAIDAGLAGSDEASRLEILRRRMGELQRSSRIDLGSRMVPIGIADGVLRLATVELKEQAGRTIANMIVDLASFTVDSDRRIAVSPGQAGAGAWPAVNVVHTGPIGRLAALASRVDSEALERELAVRLMERDVKELERLRREDEERARKEVQRQRALDAERQRALEAEAQRPVAPGNAPQDRIIIAPLPLPAQPQRPQGSDGGAAGPAAAAAQPTGQSGAPVSVDRSAATLAPGNATLPAAGATPADGEGSAAAVTADPAAAAVTQPAAPPTRKKGQFASPHDVFDTTRR